MLQLFTQLDPARAIKATSANRAGQLTRGGEAAGASVATALDHTVDQASFNSMEGLVESAPKARAEKVAALRQAIAAGTYYVSSSDVADKIIGTLLGRGFSQPENG